MGCKTPVVSTDVTGLSDLPTLKAQPTAESISDKQEEVLNNWETMRTYQYHKVLETFNLDNWERAWMQVIDTLARPLLRRRF